MVNNYYSCLNGSAICYVSSMTRIWHLARVSPNNRLCFLPADPNRYCYLKISFSDHLKLRSFKKKKKREKKDFGNYGIYLPWPANAPNNMLLCKTPCTSRNTIFTENDAVDILSAPKQYLCTWGLFLSICDNINELFFHPISANQSHLNLVSWKLPPVGSISWLLQWAIGGID